MNAGCAKSLFEQYDTNQDGVITVDEWLEHVAIENKNTIEGIES